jgi:hypothetical protein
MNASGKPPPGPVAPGAAPELSASYTTFLPLLAVLIILILSSAKDTLTLLRHKNALREQNIQARAPLLYAGKQAIYVGSIRDDLVKLAPTDPAAAKILTDFFPPRRTPSKGDSDKGQ